jgi:glycosyltransferase involved in cell wall biosynthesis
MSIDKVTGGGTATRTLQLAKSIKEDYGINCIILSTDQGLDANTKSYYSNLNSILLPCINERFYIPYFSWTKLKKIIDKVDIVHLMSHWTLINVIVYLLVRRLNKPYTFCPAGTLHIFGRSSILKRIYNFFIGSRIIQNATQCIAITELEKQDFLAFGVEKNLIKVIPNGIDSREFYPDQIAKESFNMKYGLRDVSYILFMGRLNMIKGPDILLDAFVKLSIEFPKIHLVLAGPDEGLASQLRKKIITNLLEKRVHLIGYIDEEMKIGAYTGAQILVVPSRREAMSIVAIEAGACGTPVLLTTECGFNEVKDAGCSVVQPLSEELYKELYNMFSSKQDLGRLGINFRNFVMDRYTWKNAAQKYLEFKL